MSRYSDKHNVGTTCTARECDEQATKLILMSNKPWWVCDKHAHELSQHG
jgi:hypothetical protein